MTRKTTKLSFPYALMSSTLGTILVSVTAVWLATAAYTPLDCHPTRHNLSIRNRPVPRHIRSSACRPSLLAPTGPLSPISFSTPPAPT